MAAMRPRRSAASWLGRRLLTVFFLSTVLSHRAEAQIGPGLIAWWPLNGDAQDASGNNRHGIVSGPVAAANCIGAAGSALAFDGTNDHISFGQLHPPVSGFSVSFWMKPGTALTTTGYSGENEIIGDAGGNRGFRVFQQSNLLIFQAQGSSGNGSSASTTLVAGDTTRWIHVAAVYRNRRAELWRDGQLVSQGADTGRSMDVGVRDLQIGRDVNLATSYWRGVLDEVRVHNRALALSEIQEGASTCGSAAAPMTVTASVSRSEAMQGEQVRHVVTVRNNGGQEASGVWVGGALAEGLVPDYRVDSQCSGAVFVRCEIGTLSPGATATRQFDVTLLTAGRVRIELAVASSSIDFRSSTARALASVYVTPLRIAGPAGSMLVCEPRPGCQIRADRPTVVLTHGWSSVDDLARAALGFSDFDWTGTGDLQAAGLINDVGANVNLLRFVWFNAFTLRNFLSRSQYQQAATYLYDAGLRLNLHLNALLPPGYSQDVQFIGHSFGTIVSTYAARHFLEAHPAVGRARLTALDRPDRTGYQKPNFGREFFVANLHPVVAGRSQPLDLAIENYFSNSPTATGERAAGSRLVPAYNHPNLSGPTLLDNTFFREGILDDHSGVHQWYRLSIRPNILGAGVARCEGPYWRGENDGGVALVNGSGSLSPCEQGWARSLFATPSLPFRDDELDRSYEPVGTASTSFAAATSPKGELPREVAAAVGLSPSDFENIQGCSFVTSPSATIACSETAESRAVATVNVPIDSAYLTFDYRFDASADGEHAVVFLDGVPVWLLSGDLGASQTFATTDQIPVAGMAGTRTLMVVFYGAGAMTGRFEIRNLGTTTGTPVTRYLAEGATGTFFDTRIALLNPHASATHVTLRYLSADGGTHSQQMTVPGRTRVTIDPKTADAGMQDTVFSTVVDSGLPVVVDRQMTWNGGLGSHAETAIDAPSTTWYLAEGSTSGDFALFYLLQNPGDTPVAATVRYLRPFGQPPIERTYALPPRSRTTIPVDDQGPELAQTDVSAAITATAPIIVERAMYKSTATQTFAAGHGAAGVTAPATEWFLAEGATGPFFDLFILLANPTDRPAAVGVDYLLSTGQTFSKTYDVPANGRYTIWVDNEDIPGQPASKPLANVAVSSTITSTNAVPIIVERTMWWPGPEMSPVFWTEAHNSPGTTTTGVRWALAEGEVGGSQSAETYVLIANTSSQSGQARVTLFFEDGTASERVFDLLARSRTNVNVSSDFPSAAHRRFGALIESLGDTPAQIVVERAMYTSPNGQTWAAGTNALGTRLP
jgi:uncharacterized repeat protein (TIGR01451 family)